MLTPENLIALALFSLVSSITPGPNNLMLMTSGTNFGFRRTLPHMLGVAIGFVLMVVLVGAGVAGLFQTYPVAYTVLKVGSAAYLLYLAYKIAFAAAPVDHDGKQAAKPFTFLQAAAFQWVNPKAWTMAVTATSVYVPAESPWLGLLIVACTFGVINLPSVGIWALAGVHLRRFLADPRRLRLFNIVAALLLVASLYPLLTDGLAPPVQSGNRV